MIFFLIFFFDVLLFFTDTLISVGLTCVFALHGMEWWHFHTLPISNGALLKHLKGVFALPTSSLLLAVARFLCMVGRRLNWI
jgi:hypothetical protein